VSIQLQLAYKKTRFFFTKNAKPQKVLLFSLENNIKLWGEGKIEEG